MEKQSEKVIVFFKNPESSDGLPLLEIECKFIDTQDPEIQTKLRSSQIFYKKASQKGRLVLREEKVITPTDGTFRIAKPGDVIFHVEKVDEFYSIDKSTLEMKYKLQNPSDQAKFESGEWAILETVKSPETYVHAIQIQKDIAIKAPWEEIQGVRKGGYLVSPVEKPGVVWCVDEKSFEETYFEV